MTKLLSFKYILQIYFFQVYIDLKYENYLKNRLF